MFKFHKDLFTFLVIILVSLLPNKFYAQNDDGKFIIAWNVKGNTPEELSVTIPTNPDYNYNYSVSWYRDSRPDIRETVNNITGDYTFTFKSYGYYVMVISGTFPAIYFGKNDGNNNNKLSEILQWGNNKWQTFKGAFKGCLRLQVAAHDVPDLSSVTDMSSMFEGCENLYLGDTPMEQWNTSNITNMSSMFKGCLGIDVGGKSSFNAKIDNWNTSNVANMSSMFEYAENFNRDLSHWDTSNVTDMSRMFDHAYKFNNGDVPLNSWNTSKVTDMNRMFNVAKNFNQDIRSWITSQVTDMSYMFSFALIFNKDIGGWDTRNVENFKQMFKGADKFNQNIGNWNTSKATNMERMFEQTGEFNQDITRWDVSNVTNMEGTFHYAIKFDQNIGKWNTSKVTNMQSMFENASNFNNAGQALLMEDGHWNTSKVTDMSRMFLNADAFNQDIRNWDTSKVTTMENMFNLTDYFNQYIGNWDISSVRNLSYMFGNATAFNQDMSKWDTSNVEIFDGVFNYASSFNQDLGSWKLNNMYSNEDDPYTGAYEALTGSALDCKNYTNTLNGWAKTAPNDRVLSEYTFAPLKYDENYDTGREELINKGWTIDGDEGVVGCFSSDTCHKKPKGPEVGQPTFVGISTLSGHTNSDWVTKSKNAFLKLESTKYGMALPQLSLDDINNIENPQIGMIVWNTTNQCISLYADYQENNAGEWKCIENKCK